MDYITAVSAFYWFVCGLRKGRSQLTRVFHGDLVKLGHEMEIGVGNTLMDAYVKYGTLDVARKEFDEMSQRNRVSWNTIIVVYAQNGLSIEALEL